MRQDENELLDGTDSRNAFSRLAGQIPVTETLAGLTATIAQAD